MIKTSKTIKISPPFSLEQLEVDTDKDWGNYSVKNLGVPVDAGDALRLKDLPRTATVYVAASNAKDTKNCDFLCDGVDDDLTIEEAIAALPAAGGTVMLSEGSFIFGSSLDILISYLRLLGSGAGTVIKGAIGTSYITVGNGATSLSNIEISNLRIDGTNQTEGYGIYIYGASDYIIYHTHIHDCWIEKTYDGAIRPCYSYHSILSNISISSPGSFGIYNDCSNYSVLSNITIYSSGDDGIYNHYSYHSILSNITIYSSGRYGIYNYYSTYSALSNITISSPGSHGIYNLSTQCIMLGNNIREVPYGYYGINSEGNNCVITSNITDGGNGIRALGAAPIVKNNKILNAAAPGYVLSDTSETDLGKGYNRFCYNMSVYA